jgi:hypothetical protein
LITPGLSGALSLTVAAPVNAPATLGVKATLKLHEAPAATVAPHGVLPDPAALNPPLATMLAILNVEPELFVSVTDFGALLLPTACVPKARLVGDNATGISPVPDKPVICGLPAPESDTTSAPLIAPVAVGVKVTDNVHFAALASVPPQGALPLPTAA